MRLHLQICGILEEGDDDLDVFAEDQAGKLEVSRGSVWQVDKQHAIHFLAVLIEDEEVCKALASSILDNLLQGEPLSKPRSSVVGWQNQVAGNAV